MMDIQKSLYREEAHELLGVLESSLLELEERPEDMDAVGRVFRAMHTIKGSGAMFGFDNIAAFTHSIETVFDRVREGKLRVSHDLISLTLSAGDKIRAMLDSDRDGEHADDEQARRLTDAFVSLLPHDGKTPPVTAVGPEPVRETGAPTTYRIRFKPMPGIFANGTDPVLLLNELRGLGECSVVSRMNGLPDLHEIDPEACYTSWDIILTTSCGADALHDVFIFVEDLCELSIQPVAVIPSSSGEDDAGHRKIGEILLDRGDVGEEILNQALGTQKRIGEVLVESGAIGKSSVRSALLEQEHVRNAQKKHQATEEASSIRVRSEKLDALVNLVGELVTVQARLSQFSSRNGNPDLVSINEEVEHLSAELRDIAMGIRMLPIGSIFAKFKRLVRDLSAELEKDICFITEGEETEIDKTVIDRLSDPLMHLIRNSVDHGISSPEARSAAGKPAQGTIRLRAEHSGAYVLISVSDDGKGLDEQAIRNKAVEKGLLSADAVLSDKELHHLILTPGFSTAKSVTSVSGRGVGMDVVRTNIESFGGSLEINSSRGKGTTITLKLPLTLAIIDGLLVNISTEPYVIPLGAVEECVDLKTSDRAHAHGRHLIKVREEIVPYISLRECFDIKGRRPSIEQVVITDMAGKRVGFVVDKVIGQHQTVIKSLGNAFKGIDGISGAAILGDGSVALVLDVQKLTQQVERAESSYARTAPS